MIQIIPRQVIHLVLDIFSAGMFLVHNMSVSDSKYLQFSDRLQKGIYMTRLCIHFLLFSYQKIFQESKF